MTMLLPKIRWDEQLLKSLTRIPYGPGQVAPVIRIIRTTGAADAFWQNLTISKTQLRLRTRIVTSFLEKGKITRCFQLAGPEDRNVSAVRLSRLAPPLPSAGFSTSDSPRSCRGSSFFLSKICYSRPEKRNLFWCNWRSVRSIFRRGMTLYD
jgi:hypothetical protein